MKRRDILARAGTLAAGATLSISAPAIAQSVRHLKMATDWPEALPGLQASAVRFAQTVEAASDGRIKIEVFPAGKLLRPFETLDAVGAGIVEMYQTYEGYFEKKSQALHFFTALPFGLTPTELFAWVQYGGGQELWDDLNSQFNVKSLLACSTGPQMGGWFAREIDSLESFKRLRYRMTGPGAEVLRRLGLGLGGWRSEPSRRSCRWRRLAAGSTGAGIRPGLAAVHAVLGAGRSRGHYARVTRHYGEWRMPTYVRPTQRHLSRVRERLVKKRGVQPAYFLVLKQKPWFFCPTGTRIGFKHSRQLEYLILNHLTSSRPALFWDVASPGPLTPLPRVGELTRSAPLSPKGKPRRAGGASGNFRGGLLD